MNEQQYHRMNADIEAGGFILAALEAILASRNASNVSELSASVSKTRSLFIAVKMHSGIARINRFEKVANGDVRALVVFSNVESDEQIASDWIDLIKYEEPADAVAAFDAAIKQVNDEATAIWSQLDEGEDQ